MDRSGDSYVSIIFILIGVGVCIRSITLKIGTLTEPQPGFFPFLGGSLLIIFNILLFIITLRKPVIEEQNPYGNLSKPIFLIIAMVIYILVFNSLGYLIATILLLMVFLRIMEIKSIKVIIISIILGICSYLLFDRLLDNSLPAGIMKGIF